MEHNIVITGTFLDEITTDIPSNNWGPEEWDRDFASMREMGIKRVFMIRAGFNRFLAYPSRFIPQKRKTYPVHQDFIRLFLQLAEKHGMEFWPGNYVGHNTRGEYFNDLDFDKTVADEIWEHYGQRSPAFGGWYFSKEIGRCEARETEIFLKLASHCKKISGNKPIMVSPYISLLPDVPRNAGGHIPEWMEPPMDFSLFREEWDKLFRSLAGGVDILAFQDGYIPYLYFGEICRIMKELGEKHGIKVWMNCESFDRDKPFRFPPINWNTMRCKLESAAEAGIREAITFEYSHFMSPYSLWPSAGHLRKRYMEWKNQPEQPVGLP